MNEFAQVRGKIAAGALVGYTLPSLLALNATALFTLEQLGAIPAWIKTAAAIFLAF